MSKRVYPLLVVLVLLVSLGAFAWLSGSKNDIKAALESTKKTTAFAHKLPAHFILGAPESPGRNTMTAEGVALGEALFFDAKLSRTGTHSCSSCHMPTVAFASNFEVDPGIFGSRKMGVRNTPSVLYSGWGEKFFWDGSAANLESQALGPLTDSAEMGAKLTEVLAYLNGSAKYRAQFKTAFGVDSIQTAYVLRALGQFQRSLYRFSSKWDSVQAGKTQFNPAELKGEAVFTTKCAACHTPPLFTDNQFHNKGLVANMDSVSNLGKASGRYRITRHLPDMGAFKTPTLRNVALTAPYAHNGSVETLEDLLDRMDGKLHRSPWLDSALARKDGLGGLVLSKDEKASLVAFLNCLTD